MAHASRTTFLASLVLCAAYFATAQIGSVNNPVFVPYNPAQNPGTDWICALAKDSSLFLDGTLKTVTVTTGSDTSLPNSGTWTTTGGGGTGASGTFTATTGNLATVTILVAGSGYTSNPTFVPNSGTIGTSTTAFSGCPNTSNATSEKAFATTISIPANTITNSPLSRSVVPVNLGMAYVSSSSAATATVKLRYGTISGTIIYTSGSLSANSISYLASRLHCAITALGLSGASTPVIVGCSAANLGGVNANTVPAVGSLTTAIAANATTLITPTVTFGAATAGNALLVYSISPQ